MIHRHSPVIDCEPRAVRELFSEFLIGSVRWRTGSVQGIHSALFIRKLLTRDHHAQITRLDVQIALRKWDYEPTSAQFRLKCPEQFGLSAARCTG
jgi:hypothetical protein